jgi:hypothetical protein
VILPGITSSETRNPPEEFRPLTANTHFHGINNDSAGNNHLIDVESTVRMGFPPGITSSGTRNPPKEGDSTGNYQLTYSDSGR